MAFQLILATAFAIGGLVAFAPGAGAADCFAPDPATGELRRVECPPPTTAPPPPVTAPPATSPPVTAPPAAPVTTRPPATTPAPAPAPPPPEEPVPAPIVTAPPTASTLAMAPANPNVASTTTSTLLTNTVEAASRPASNDGGVNTFVIAGVIAALATLVLVGIVLLDGMRRRFQPPMET